MAKKFHLQRPELAEELESIRERAVAQLLACGQLDEGVEILRRLLDEVGLRYPGSARTALVGSVMTLGRILLLQSWEPSRRQPIESPARFHTVRRSASKNSSDCSRSPRVCAATRAASAASTGASGRPVDCASTWAWQARSR